MRSMMGRGGTRWAKALVAGGVVLMTALPLSAQDEQADPLQCWWRTSSGSIRVGEVFSAVLTCAVLETDAAKVIVDQSKLEPSVVQFAPFEVTGGSHGADLRTDQRRFFQYEYRLRLISENLFGKDVSLPETKISYHVQSAVAQGAAIQGREQTYILPPQPVRVMSLVPADASDIRDTTSETFEDVDRRTFRANLLIVTGGVLFALAGLMALLTLVRLFTRFRQPAAQRERLVTDAAVLSAIGRELKSVQRAREDGGWTPSLAGRALGALRPATAMALGRRVAQTTFSTRLMADGSRQSPVLGQESALDGQVAVAGMWPGGKRVVVSGSVTPQAVAHEIGRGRMSAARAALLESVQEALTRFTVAQYGRQTTLDDAALDESMAASTRLVRRLKMERFSVMKWLGRRRAAPELESRVWSR
jgi:hypothetical protein